MNNMDMTPRYSQQMVEDATKTKDLQHATSLLATLALLRRNRQYCDVLLQAKDAVSQDDEELGVWAHSAVLAAASTFFYAKFYGDIQENKVQIVVIEDVMPETLQALVEHIYSPALLPANIETAKALLVTAKQLGVDDVQDAASAFLVHSLSINNVLSIRDFANLQDCSALTVAASQYIRGNFQQLLDNDVLLQLSPTALRILIESAHLAVVEERILDAMTRWPWDRFQERRSHLVSLLRTAKQSQVSHGLADCNESGALHLVAETLALDHEVPKQSHNPQTLTKLYVMGGITDAGCSSAVYFCSPPDGRWQCAAPLPAPLSRADGTLYDGRVYVVGGWDGSSAVRTTFIYDVATDSWSSGPSISTPRRWPGVAVLGGRLYALGGWVSGSKWLQWLSSGVHHNSAEALDPREGVWRAVAPMAIQRRGLGVVALDGMLYAVGGHDGNIPLNSTERFNPAAGWWEPSETMSVRRTAVRVGVVDGTIYAVGGYDGTARVRSVEKYRVGSSWQSAPPMSGKRDGVAVTVHGHQLYVAGGNDGSKKLNNVSVLDTTTDIWSELPPLPEACQSAVVVAWP